MLNLTSVAIGGLLTVSTMSPFIAETVADRLSHRTERVITISAEHFDLGQDTPASRAVSIPADPFGEDRNINRIYFDAEPLTKIAVPVLNVFRPGVVSFGSGKFLQNTIQQDSERRLMEPAKAPVGCEPLITAAKAQSDAQQRIGCVDERVHLFAAL